LTKCHICGILFFMNVGETQELLNELNRDLAAEPDPHTRAWYEEEFKLQPEHAEAIRTQEQLGILAKQLGELVQLKAERQTEELGEDNEKEEPVEPDVPEQPIILTPEQQLHKRIERKYAADYKQYQTELDHITTAKKSKREHQEKMARRQFIRHFTDFSDVTGDKHLVLRTELLDYITTELCDDPEVADEIYASCADYAERHGAEVTSNPNNFAIMIAGSVPGQPCAPQFESIIKSIFSTRHNAPDFLKININLANSAFELLENQPALAKIVQIATLNLPSMSPRYLYEIAKEGNEAFFLRGDIQSSIDTRQARMIFDMLNGDITGLNIANSPAGVEAVNSLHKSQQFNDMVDSASLSRLQERFLELVQEDGNKRLSDYDPVTLDQFDGTRFDLGLLEMPNELKEFLLKSTLFRKRMEYFAPFSYSVMAAKQILEAEGVKGGVNGVSIPLSPSVAVDVYFPFKQWPPSHSETDDLRGRAGALMPEFLGVAMMAKELGIRGFEEKGDIHMVYRPLDPRVEVNAISIYRACLPTDKRTHSPLQQLMVNYIRSRVGAKKFPEALNDTIDFKAEAYEEDNEHLRRTIKAQQKRFLGRRPIKFSMPDEIRVTGLETINLRYDPKRNRITSLLSLDDGQVELELDREFHIQTGVNSNFNVLYPNMKLYYENLILKLAREWMCANEINTSEGLISDENGRSANMGHYSYLRIRESDGRRYRHSEDQAKACREEQNRNLAQESERLKPLDPTGRQRNSTYVRENYDPNKPPLEVYYASLD